MFDLRQTVPNRWADVTKYFPSNLLFHDQLLHGLTEVQVNAKRMGLAVTCPQQFWQSDWDILCATVVTWGWNGYWYQSVQKSWPWRVIICCSYWGSNLWPFNQESGTLPTTELSPPCVFVVLPWGSLYWHYMTWVIESVQHQKEHIYIISFVLLMILIISISIYGQLWFSYFQ